MSVAELKRGDVTAQVIRDADIRLEGRTTKEGDEVGQLCRHLLHDLPLGTQSFYFPATPELPARELCRKCGRLALFLEDFEAAMSAAPDGPPQSDMPPQSDRAAEMAPQ
jgi:hypothetical protein